MTIVLLTGCSSLFPKRVEFGQDKVQSFPSAKDAEREVQRQTAERAARLAGQTVNEGRSEGVSTKVLKPAEETAILTRAISTSLGPPAKPASPGITSEELAQKLDKAVAALNSRIDEFKKDNDANAGKKIEGTGFLQIPYFVYIAVVGALAFIGFIVLTVVWAALKAYSISNPPLALGLNAVQLGGKGLSNLASQLIKGGETFKEKVQSQFDDPAVAAKVLEIFRDSHQKEQSPENQRLVKNLVTK